MRILKIIPAIFLVCLSLHAYPQTATNENVQSDKPATAKINEGILSLSYAGGGINFGLLYKRQVAEKRFFRMSLADISF